ncbi:MAG: hypothetical protein J7L16_10705 [Deltaproteobacteria bacterium]|nr:hypothetical protein [Deltaproteobacteria bacterium]
MARTLLGISTSNGDGTGLLFSPDKVVSQIDSFAKKAAAFFNISRSISSSLFSFFQPMILSIQLFAGNVTLIKIMLFLVVLPRPTDNTERCNTKTSAKFRAAIPLFDYQLDGILFEFFRVIWTFLFLVHWTPRFLYNCS